MVIKINPDHLTEKGKETLRNYLEKRHFDKNKKQEEIGKTFTQEPEPEIKNSRELPAGLPDYAYEVDKNFKNETGNNRNPEMMKKIDEAVLKMREDGIFKTESKDGGVYTTINFPNEKTIHFLEPDLSKYSDERFNETYCCPFGGSDLYKTLVKLGGMRGNIDKWKNKKLKEYVKQSGLYLPEQSKIEGFMQKLSDFVNQNYGLNIGRKGEKIDLFCRAINSIGRFWLGDNVGRYRPCLMCGNSTHFFYSDNHYIGPASFFLTDYDD